MARSTYGGSSNSPWATGQENYDFSVLFDDHSTSNFSHNFTVSENFVRVAAFNLVAGDVLTIQQVTGQGPGTNFADYCPVLGPATLYYNSATDQRTSLVLERPGTYRVHLTGPGLGTVRCFAIRFYMENESNSDLTDALTTLIEHLDPDPCDLGALIAAPGVQPNTGRVVILNDDGCMREAQLVSDDPGNITVLHTDGVYTPITSPCDLGLVIDQGGLQPSVNTIVAVDTTGPDPSNCLIEMQLVSDDVGNIIELRADGVFAEGGGAGDPCEIGAAIAIGGVQDTTNYVAGFNDDNCLIKEQLVSGGAGNLIQLRPDGVYYGTQSPLSQIYVSSSMGSDEEGTGVGQGDGSYDHPYYSIAKAISRVVDGTMCNILLFRGDIFYLSQGLWGNPYPYGSDPLTDEVTIASPSALKQIFIGTRQLTFLPYGTYTSAFYPSDVVNQDAALGYIQDYDLFSGNSVVATVRYGVHVENTGTPSAPAPPQPEQVPPTVPDARINFPEIRFQYQTWAGAGTGEGLPTFFIGATGSSLTFRAIQLSTASLAYIANSGAQCFFGDINVNSDGGSIVIGSLPLFGTVTQGNYLGGTVNSSIRSPTPTQKVFAQPLHFLSMDITDGTPAPFTHPVGSPHAGVLQNGNVGNLAALIADRTLWKDLVARNLDLQLYRNLDTNFPVGAISQTDFTNAVNSWVSGGGINDFGGVVVSNLVTAVTIGIQRYIRVRTIYNLTAGGLTLTVTGPISSFGATFPGASITGVTEASVETPDPTIDISAYLSATNTVTVQASPGPTVGTKTVHFWILLDVPQN